MLRDRNPVQFLRQIDREDPDSHEVIPGEWREGEEIVGRDPMRNPRAMVAPKNIRNYLVECYNTRGAVEWQDRILDN